MVGSLDLKTTIPKIKKSGGVCLEVRVRVARQEVTSGLEEKQAQMKNKTSVPLYLSLRQRLITEAVVTPRSSSLRRTRPRPSCQSLERPMGAAQVLLAPPLLSQLPTASISTQVDFIYQSH